MIGLPELDRIVQQVKPCCGQSTMRCCIGPITRFPTRRSRVFVFPNITINCTGSLTGLRVAGGFEDGLAEQNLLIWRKYNRSNNYSLQHSIPLSQCCSAQGNTLKCNNTYGVVTGDTIGVQLPTKALSNRSVYFLFNAQRMTRAYHPPDKFKTFNMTNLLMEDPSPLKIIPLISMKILPGWFVCTDLLNNTY